MHKLLARQLKRHLGTSVIPESWAALLATVDEAYAQYDADRALLERSLELTSEDLNARYVQLQHDTEQHVVVERELATIKEEARTAADRARLAEMRSRFVTQASHEFRTPLAVILAATDILTRYHDRLDTAERTARLDKIRTAVAAMTELLDEVLTYGRGDAGQTVCSPARIDVRAVCEEVLGEVQTTAAVTRDLVLACDGEALVALDPKLFRRILGNLVTNAVKYSPVDSPVTVTAISDHAGIELRVSDRGIGIPAEDQARLFQPFHRGANVGTLPGYGLGLAITRDAVRAHGGTIDVESAPGAGTTVVVVLPCRTAEEPETA
jgi:signal transduction histidine kinase